MVHHQAKELALLKSSVRLRNTVYVRREQAAQKFLFEQRKQPLNSPKNIGPHLLRSRRSPPSATP